MLPLPYRRDYQDMMCDWTACGKDASLPFSDNTDPDNPVDLSAKKPDRVAQMSQDIKNWLQETGPVLPKNSH